MKRKLTTSGPGWNQMLSGGLAVDVTRCGKMMESIKILDMCFNPEEMCGRGKPGHVVFENQFEMTAICSFLHPKTNYLS